MSNTTAYALLEFILEGVFEDFVDVRVIGVYRAREDAEREVERLQDNPKSHGWNRFARYRIDETIMSERGYD